jgi:hypothetical protein
MDVHWQKPGVTNYIQRCERKSTNKSENEACLASDVLAPVLSTLFSLGQNPERTESIYTISQMSLRHLLMLSSTYAEAF